MPVQAGHNRANGSAIQSTLALVEPSVSGTKFTALKLPTKEKHA